MLNYTKRVSVVTFAVVLLAGCASNSKEMGFANDWRALGVDSATLVKVETGEKLDLRDIVHLSQKGASENQLIKYLKMERKIYRIDVSEVETLRRSGVSQPIIDYLVSTPSRYKSKSMYGQGAASLTQ